MSIQNGDDGTRTEISGGGAPDSAREISLRHGNQRREKGEITARRNRRVRQYN